MTIYSPIGARAVCVHIHIYILGCTTPVIEIPRTFASIDSAARAQRHFPYSTCIYTSARSASIPQILAAHAWLTRISLSHSRKWLKKKTREYHKAYTDKSVYMRWPTLRSAAQEREHRGRRGRPTTRLLLLLLAATSPRCHGAALHGAIRTHCQSAARGI